MTAKPLGRTGMTVTDREAAKNAEERLQRKDKEGAWSWFGIYDLEFCDLQRGQSGGLPPDSSTGLGFDGGVVTHGCRRFLGWR